jgi:hypothetical protein
MTSLAQISLRRLITAALFVAVIALAPAATATAEPEWDIDAYDKCVANGNVGDSQIVLC